MEKKKHGLEDFNDKLEEPRCVLIAPSAELELMANCILV